MSELEIIDKSPTLAYNLKLHEKAVTDLSFHPDGHLLASCSLDKSVLLWNLNSANHRCYKLTGHTGSVNSVQFSNSGHLIASGSSDQTVRLWSPTIGGTSHEFKAHSSAVRTVAFSPTDGKILTGSNDKILKLWDTKKMRFISSFTGHTNWINCADFSIDESFIASCADDKTLRIWDINSGQCVHVFTFPKSHGNHLAIHSKGTSVVVAMSSGTVRLYDLRSKKLKQHYELYQNTYCVDWHPYANYLLSCGSEGKLNIIDVMEGRPLYVIEGHLSNVRTAKFSKNGEQIASAGEDNHILIWNTNFVSRTLTSSGTSTESLS